MVCFGVVLAACGSAEAHTRHLNDNNAQVTIGVDDNFGMGQWIVDGVSQMNQQQFWYRNGNSGGEKPISALNLLNEDQPAANLLNVLYGNSAFTIEINYTLTGGANGSGYATIGEQIKITNLSANPLDFHFFQYVDFDLGGSDAGDTLYLNQNLQGLFDAVYQNKGSFYFADEIISPGADRGQVNEQSAGLVLLHSLNNNSPTTLNNYVGPVTGDAAWAIQWDPVIPVGGYFQIAISKSAYLVPIPEPSALAIISLGGMLLAMRRSSSSKK